jgi:hypothetical protein
MRSQRPKRSPRTKVSSLHLQPKAAEGRGGQAAAEKGLEPPPPAEGSGPKPAGDGGLKPPPAGGDKGHSLDNPDLGAPPAGPAAAGGLGNIVIGGTLDYRVLVPSDMKAGMYEIHVNELFITTNLGDHIAILAGHSCSRASSAPPRGRTTASCTRRFPSCRFSRRAWRSDSVGCVFATGSMPSSTDPRTVDVPSAPSDVHRPGGRLDHEQGRSVTDAPEIASSDRILDEKS